MSAVFLNLNVLGRRIPLLKTKNIAPSLYQAANISGKALRSEAKTVKPKPWPYQDKRYGILQALFEKTTKRFDENSKVICVEGPIGIGKSKFAKELADDLEMLYIPEATMDMTYINPYGYDMRKLDPQMPPKARSYDIRNFCNDPKNPLAAQMQIRMYMNRYSQYIDALAHVLSTGQGVVLDRSPYSDFVFLEAMYRNGYISSGAKSIYYEIKQNTIGELLQPHLVIYLDAPVNIVKDRIKARNLSYENESKVFTDGYLKDVETVYKQQFLRDISVHAELLVYDWSAEGETEVVVEDIERIDFDQFESNRHNKKMKDWRLPLEWSWCEQRMKFSSNKDTLMNYFNVPRFDVPELVWDADTARQWCDVWYNAPGMKYCLGYNEDMGDTGIISKTKMDVRDGL